MKIQLIEKLGKREMFRIMFRFKYIVTYRNLKLIFLHRVFSNHPVKKNVFNELKL